jgi:SSS family solute:Na+ symporter
VGAFLIAGVFIGKRASSGEDFSLGGRQSGAAGVCGILLGALVGGASTIGTTQMAYSYGLPAIWFTTGGGIGCLLLGLYFAKPLRSSGITTIADYLENSYPEKGSAISLTATVSSSIGTFTSVSAQFLSCIALLRGTFSLSAPMASALSAIFILGFIASGGLKSFSKLGAAKIALLFAVLLVCAGAAVKHGNTPYSVLSAIPHGQFLNPLGRGAAHDLGALLSMIVGIFTTQIYIQSLAAAKDAKTARQGAFLSALLMPPMGFLGIWIGLTVRARGIDMPPSHVLPWFIMDSFPPVLAGVVWAGVLITIIGCAAGLLLGVATNVYKNLLPQRMRGVSEAQAARAQRAIILALVLIAASFGVVGENTLILELSYLSMGLRGAGTFLPFVFAVLRPGRLSAKWALASSVCGLAGTILWAIAKLPGDPLYAGLAASALFLCIGWNKTKQ